MPSGATKPCSTNLGWPGNNTDSCSARQAIILCLLDYPSPLPLAKQPPLPPQPPLTPYANCVLMRTAPCTQVPAAAPHWLSTISGLDAGSKGTGPMYLWRADPPVNQSIKHSVNHRVTPLGGQRGRQAAASTVGLQGAQGHTRYPSTLRTLKCTRSLCWRPASPPPPPTATPPPPPPPPHSLEPLQQQAGHPRAAANLLHKRPQRGIVRRQVC